SLVEEFRALTENVVELIPGVQVLSTFDDAKAQLIEGAHEGLPQPAWAYPSRMIRLPAGMRNGIFVKGVRILDLIGWDRKTDTWHNPSTCSYDLGLANIPPDRGSLSDKLTHPWIAFLLAGCTDQTVAEEILKSAKDQSGTSEPEESEALYYAIMRDTENKK